MYMIPQHLFAAWKHIEVFIKNRPKLLIAAVILFGLIWAVMGPIGGSEKLVFYYMSKDALLLKGEALAEFAQMPPEQNPTYLASPTLGILIESDFEETHDDGLIDLEDIASTFQGLALITNAGPITFITQEPRDEAVTYIVQEGDVPSTIAAAHGVSTYTLLWANKLSDGSLIRPGDELTILPVSGILHRVKDGDTIGAIAKKYEATESDILAFNGLPADGVISIGQDLIIPDGVMPAPPRPQRSYVAARSTVSGPGTGKSRNFPYGQCTYYVAQKRYVPWNGHAKNWIANAQAYGFPVCWGSQCQPKAGAIVSLKGSSWLSRLYGHVAYVESVSDGWFTISEMNYAGWAVRTVRTIQAGASNIQGFIY